MNIPGRSPCQSQRTGSDVSCLRLGISLLSRRIVYLIVVVVSAGGLSEERSAQVTFDRNHLYRTP